jgi:hypothetical protein
MLDPTIIAAIVTALGTAGNTLFKRWIGSGDNATPRSEEAQAEHAIEANYDKLRPDLSDRLVRLLVILSYHNLPPSLIAKQLYPDTPPSEALEREIEYRCKFLALLGLVMVVAGSRYSTTVLGRSFLTVAQAKGDYRDVKFDEKEA